MDLKEAWHIYFTPDTNRVGTSANRKEQHDVDAFSLDSESVKLVRSFSTL